MSIDEISTVCFVGAGTMGCANSLVAAVSGYRVVLVDAVESTVAAAPTRHVEIGEFLVGVGYCSQDDLGAGLDRITLATDLTDATREADLVSESVFERLDLKRSVHAELDRICPPRCLLTTNTSALLVSDIEDAVDRGDRFAALHSYLGSLLVDIVAGPRTSPQTIEILVRYVESLRATPLVLRREHPGYVVNALLGPLLTTAMRLHLEQGIPIDDIDRGWMHGRDAPMGPFAMIDLFGVDLVLDTWTRNDPEPTRRRLADRIVPFLEELVDAGRLGTKSGAGFYDYPDPVFQQPGFAVQDPAGTGRPLTASVMLAGLGLLAADVADADDIDRAWVTATMLDSGPLALAQQLGSEQLRADVDALVALGLAPSDAADLIS